MEKLSLVDVSEYVNENIVDFHKRRIKSLESLTLDKLLKKNPYLFKAKNISTAGQLIESLLDAFLSSSEEKLFGDFFGEFSGLYCRQNVPGAQIKRARCRFRVHEPWHSLRSLYQIGTQLG
ncbi:MAG: hypothetical protein Fur0021_30720 [Candidatus Promineifilaceae bacterium]